MDSQEKYNAVFAVRLRALLDEHKVTITTLANELGVSRQAVSQYADGSTQPNGEKLVLIAKYFGASTDYLLGLSDVQTPDADVQAIHEKTGLNEEAIKRLIRWKKHDANDLAQLISWIAESTNVIPLLSLLAGRCACPENAAVKIPGVPFPMDNVVVLNTAIDKELQDMLGDFTYTPRSGTLKDRAEWLWFMYQHGGLWDAEPAEEDNNGKHSGAAR